MAFVDFTLGRAPRATPIAPVTGPAGAGFSPVEWTVIRLARRDRLSTVRPVGRLAGLLHRLFGLEPANRLADPRLEALRRVAVRCWHGAPSLDRAHVEELDRAGFDLDQVALLAAHIQVTRARAA